MRGSFRRRRVDGAFGGCDACFLEADGDDGWMLDAGDAGGLAFFNGSGWYILALKGVEGDDKGMAGGLSVNPACYGCLLFLQW